MSGTVIELPRRPKPGRLEIGYDNIRSHCANTAKCYCGQTKEISGKYMDMNAIQDKKLVLSLYTVMFVGLLLFIGIVIFYKLNYDNTWFAEQAYWLVKDGIVRSEFFSSPLNYGAQQFVYHKLHIWIAALAIKVFGLSYIYIVLNCITLTFFFVFLLVSRRYFYDFHHEYAQSRFMIFLAFILINSLVMELVFVYRPEIAMMCFGLVEFLLINKALSEQRFLYILLAGLFAGLCVLMHLNGLIFIVSGMVLFLTNMEIKKSIWFGIAAGVVASLYFVDVFPGHWGDFWMQFRHDPAIPNGQFQLVTLPQRILFEYKRFFGHGYESGYSLLLLTVIVSDYKFIWRQSELRNCLIFFAALSLTLAAISPGKKHFYLLFGLPYAGIMVSASLLRIFNQARKTIKSRAVIAVAILYVVANVPHAIAIIKDGMHWKQHHRIQINEEVMRDFNINRGDKVLAPLLFVFNSIEKVDVQGVNAYIMRGKRGDVPLTAKSFFGAAARNNREFILMLARQMTILKITPKRDKDFYGYTYLGNMYDYYVFKRAGVIR